MSRNKKLKIEISCKELPARYDLEKKKKNIFSYLWKRVVKLFFALMCHQRALQVSSFCWLTRIRQRTCQEIRKIFWAGLSSWWGISDEVRDFLLFIWAIRMSWVFCFLHTTQIKMLLCHSSSPLKKLRYKQRMMNVLKVALCIQALSV